MSTGQDFLLVFDRARNKLVECINFGTDSDRAVSAYSAMEHRHRDNPHMDVLLVGSDSLDTIRVTHSTYFEEGMNALLHDLMQPIG